MPETKEHLVAAIQTKIKDSFEEGDFTDEMTLTCPFDQQTRYDIHLQDRDHYDVIVDEMMHPIEAKNRNLGSLDAAKHRVAALIADNLLLAKDMLGNAEAQGLHLD
jgi:hypothetical protein